MNYIITRNKEYYQRIGEYNYCDLDDMILPDTISVDSEDTGLEARKCDMFCVQLGTGDNNYIIDLYSSGEDSYKFEELIPYIKDKTLIFHNALFDLGFFYKHSFYPEKILDTMLASKIIYNGAEDEDNYNLPYRHDFGSVMKRELNVYYDKFEQKNIHIVKLFQASTIEYSFNDVDRLIELHDVLLSKINNNGFKETYELHCRYIRALAYMEQCGMPISSELWKAKMKEDVVNASKWKKRIEEYIFDNLPQFADKQFDMFDEEKRILISITSSLQMLKVFKALNIPTKDKDGKDSINEAIISKSKHEFVKLWLDFQEANHRVTTFGDKIYQQIENERIYTNFNPMVDTARLSTRKGNINFLNFPSDKETRTCFKANKGNVMIVCDYSGQETVVAADLSGDAAMSAAVIDGADLHCMLSRILFPDIAYLSDEEIIKNHKDKRQASKAPRFAMQYGGNAFTIHMNEGIPLKRAQEIENGFKELHAGLYEWGDKVFQEAVKKGYIESADGWKLALPKFDKFKECEAKVKAISKEEWQMYKQGKLEYKKKKEEAEKKIVYTYKFPKSVVFYNSKKSEVKQFFKLKSEYQRLSLNNPVQARSAHQLKLATCILFEWILENNLINQVLIVNAVHDELVVECKEYYEILVKNKVEEAMLQGGNHYLTNLKIKAEANIGDSWGSAK
jgi:DNA polymerase I-like protein with 3'-5' exonuclease and polymerase domains